MRRINTSTKATDLHGPGKHGFKAGNSLTGELPTQLSSDYCDDIQEEIANVIEGAGAVLGANQSQLLAAIIALADQRAAMKTTQVGLVAYYARTTAPLGWVALRGGTIGNDASGASERAHADAHDLFLLLWNEFDDTAAPVIGGRGASAEVDWAVGKCITLFDDRGLFHRAHDDTSLVNPDGTAIGAIQGDALQGFKIQVPASVGGAYSGGGVAGTYMTATADKLPVSDGTNGAPRISSETRPKSRTYLACIKL